MKATITLMLDTKICSTMNMREHWAVRHKRHKAQRKLALLMCLSSDIRRIKADKYTITLTRYGKRKLDDDNLASGFKAVRDGIADALQIDDGDSRLKWVYKQVQDKKYCALVEIECK